MSRVKDFEEEPIGKADNNPILDTRVRHVEFSDGENAELGANTIEESMYAQCDIEGNHCRLMNHIVDLWKDNDADSKENKIVTVDGKSYIQKIRQVRHPNKCMFGLS